MTVFVVVMRNTANVKVFANKEDAEAFKQEVISDIKVEILIK